MGMVQLEPIQHGTIDKPTFRSHPSHSKNFARTLEGMQNNLEGKKALSADQARMVIRMVGAAITGQFQEVSGWSGEQAENFFARFNMLRTYSNSDPGLVPTLASSHAQQVSRAYQDMSPATAQTPNRSASVTAAIQQPSSSVASAPESSTPQDAASSSTIDIHQLIDRVAKKMDLPAKLVHSVVFAESSYRPDAVSPAGAEGLMQLMPTTASEVGVKDTFDAQDNLTGGCRYLKGLLEKYHGDLDHALAAYNWGQGNVDRKGLEQMPLETRNYIAKVKQGLEGQV
jgi:soluble lytic murein transglycosylase-like protein